jgi:hypothetical protein
MKEELINVLLYEADLTRMLYVGRTCLYGIDRAVAIDPDHSECLIGRSVVPEKFAPLFCDDEERKNFPLFYERCLEDDEPADAEGTFIFSNVGNKTLYELYNLRFVPGYWTVSEGYYLHVFSTQYHCLAWIRERKNFTSLFVRAPSGEQKMIQLVVELV